MRSSLLLVMLSAAPAGAVVYAFDHSLNSNVSLPFPPGALSFTAEHSETININDRTGLTPGVPIRVTVLTPGLAGAANLYFSTPYTYQDTFTFAAILGSQTFSTSSTFTRVSDLVLPDPVGGAFAIGLAIAPIEFTVPWDTDLSAFTLRLSQSATLITAGDAVIFGGGGGLVPTIETQSVPEPGAGMLAAGAIGALGLRRRGVRPAA